MNSDNQGSDRTETTILVIDDDPNNLAIMADYLGECGYAVLVAEDGESGLKRATLTMPDLILLDVLMPGFDGYETCRRLKEAEATRDIPVIFMTALSEMEYKVRGFREGAVDYISKPFEREEVVARVGVHLRLRELTRRLVDAKSLLEKRVEERTTELTRANEELQTEIAERNLAEEALRKSERKFRAIFDQTFQFIGLVTLDGTLIEANRTSLKFCNISEREVLGRPFWETPWWNHSPELQETLKTAIASAAGGEFVRFEATHRAGDGSLRYIDFSLKPVMDEEGDVVMLIPEGRDITERKLAEEALAEKQRLLEELNISLEQRVADAVSDSRKKDQMMILQGRQAAMGEMIGNIAHQWRQPLNTLGLIVQELRMTYGHDQFNKESLEASVKKAMELISNMSQTIDYFSNYFKPDTEKMSFNVNQAIVKTLYLVEPSLKNLDINIEVIVMGDVDINGYANEYSQVLLNILLNCRDAFETGNIDRQRVITITVFKENNKSVVTIADNAGGIPEAVMDKIFDPYFTTKGPDKGTGIGLYMAIAIIEKNMGGRLTVRNTEDGVEFRIEV